MATFEKVLWALDNEIQPSEFERLCVDLLSREGYRHIEPSGGTNDIPPMQDLFSKTLNSIGLLFAALGGNLLAASKPTEQKNQIDLLSRGILCLLELAATETGRMYGIISGNLNLSKELVENGKKADLTNVLGEAAAELVIQTCKDWGLSCTT